MIQVLKIGKHKIFFKPSIKGGMLKGDEEEDVEEIALREPHTIAVREKEEHKEEEGEKEAENGNELLENIEAEIASLPENTLEEKIKKTERKIVRTKLVIKSFEEMLKKAREVKDLALKKEKIKKLTEEKAREKYGKLYEELFTLYDHSLKQGFIDRDYKIPETFSIQNLFKLCVALGMTIYKDSQIETYQRSIDHQRWELRKEEGALEVYLKELKGKPQKKTPKPTTTTTTTTTTSLIPSNLRTEIAHKFKNVNDQKEKIKEIISGIREKPETTNAKSAYFNLYTDIEALNDIQDTLLIMRQVKLFRENKETFEMKYDDEEDNKATFEELLLHLKKFEKAQNKNLKIPENYSTENFHKALMASSITIFTDDKIIQYMRFADEIIEDSEKDLRDFNRYFKGEKGGEKKETKESKELIERNERELLESLPSSKSKKKPTISEASIKHYEELIKAPEKEERIISHLPEKARQEEIEETIEDRQYREFNEHRIKINASKNKTKNRDYEPNYSNLQISLNQICTEKSIGLGLAFEEICTGSGQVSGLLKRITGDSSEIVLTSTQNELLDIVATIEGLEENQLRCFVYDLIQLRAIIECKNFNTHNFFIDINTRRIISDGVPLTLTLKGREPTKVLPGMPMTKTKFVGNDSFLPIFEEKEGRIVLYDILQQHPETGKALGYTLTNHNDQQVIFFWYTKNGLISFNLTEDIIMNPQDYERRPYTTKGKQLNTFHIIPRFPVDVQGHNGRGANYYIPFDRMRYHNKLV